MNVQKYKQRLEQRLRENIMTDSEVEAIHAYIRKVKTKPDKCPDCGKPKRLCLSNIKNHQYTLKPEDYVFRCWKCHSKFDKVNETLRAQQIDVPYEIRYGERANEIRAKLSIATIGEKNPMYNQHHTLETRKQISQKKLGSIPWNKGRTGVYSKDTINKMSETRKGLIPWNKGLTGVYSEETLKKMRKPRTDLQRQQMSGANHWNWKGGISSTWRVKNGFQ